MNQADDFADLYQEVILDHGRKPRHGQRLEAFDVTAKGDNPINSPDEELLTPDRVIGLFAAKIPFT